MIKSSEISTVCRQLRELFDIKKMYIFGIKQKGAEQNVTDFDICLVLDFAEEEKNAITSRIFRQVESEIPFDVYLYTPGQFDTFAAEPSSFVSRILRQGYEYGEA